MWSVQYRFLGSALGGVGVADVAEIWGADFDVSSREDAIVGKPSSARAPVQTTAVSWRG